MAKIKPDDMLWKLTDHCCRVCFGRVLVRETFDMRKVYRCANCGVEREGRDSRVICSCGLRLLMGQTGLLRCERNTSKTPEFPSEIVAGAVNKE